MTNSLLKRTLIVAILLGVSSLLVLSFIQRFTISIPNIQSQCLETTMFIVDKHDIDIQPGDLVAFTFNKDDPHFDKGMSFIKIVAAKSGDSVSVSQDELKVNGQKVGIAGMRHVVNFLELNPSDYEYDVVIEENELFVVGETIYSYDSRYWGAIDTSTILGKAYAIF